MNEKLTKMFEMLAKKVELNPVGIEVKTDQRWEDVHALRSLIKVGVNMLAPEKVESLGRELVHKGFFARDYLDTRNSDGRVFLKARKVSDGISQDDIMFCASESGVHSE
jgi:hypothetical protein